MSKVNLASAATLRTPSDLVAHGLASAADLPDLEKVAARYAVAVTADIAALIDPDDPDDPIARQFIPNALELVGREGESADPIGDHVHSPVAGIVHRYPDRVLFKLVHVCAVYCRFCFRREMVGPGKANALPQAAYDTALDYIRAHPEIWEVILTGGDPLMLSPRRLTEVMADLAAIDHVRIIRIHTRVPVADPERITPELISALKVTGATTWVALHANHVRELTGKARAACADMIDAGIPMVSQSVLLRGVNDDAATLEALMRGLRRMPDQALLSSSRRPRARHRASANDTGTWPGTNAGLAGAGIRIMSTGLRDRYPRRLWQGAGRPELSVAGRLSAQVNSFPGKGEEQAEIRYRVTDYCGDVHLYPPKSY